MLNQLETAVRGALGDRGGLVHQQMHQPSEVTTEPAAPVKIVARRVATQPRSQRIPEGHEPTGAYTHEDVNAVLWFGRKAGLRI